LPGISLKYGLRNWRFSLASSHVGARVARFFLTQFTKMVKNMPNGHKIYLHNGRKTFDMSKIHKHSPLQGPPKFTQNWDFWFENIPSGNPGWYYCRLPEPFK
jgi:hypothetical protein